jgi:DNA-binding MarR family transcriptional regulator
MTRIVNGLEERGLVTRQPDPHDRRSARVSLTESGRQILLANRRRRDQWLAVRIAELEPEERDVLRQCVRILDKVNHA